MSCTDTTVWFESDLTCKPLNNLRDIQMFLYDPPAWRTLCEPISRHSTKAIKNSEVNEDNIDSLTLDRPQSFCHFKPESPSVARYDEKNLPKVLVCHDMANGYHDDSMIDGTTNHEAYTFYNWAAVDIFCYFSHHLITIPPLAWINVAHAHGVKVIGTLITEWSEGLAFWNEVLHNPGEMENLVSSLVTIAKTLKFEGWLINVENKITEPEKLLEFIELLHSTLHQEIPDAELIWYDSVITDGQLIWQNALNEHNRPFFDACDGIFTNYSWKIPDIVSSVQEAGSRLRDLYIGIDVWGRNFYGGGKFNTQKAVRAVYKHGCSLAIFAPAWTHEAMADDDDYTDPERIIMGEDLIKHESFLLRDEAFWGSLWPFLKTRLPNTLPFKTSFCLGLGNKRRMYGEVLCNSPWYNLRHMQYQPNSRLGDHKFLLSTKKKITRASQSAITDVRGILKIRQSYMQIQSHDDNDDDDIERVKKVQIQDDITDQKSGDEHNTEDHNEKEHDADHEESSSSKSKNLFHRLFHRDRKKDDHDHDHPETSIHETNELTSQHREKTVSLIATQAPVKLNLDFEKQGLKLLYIHEEKRCLEVYYGDSFNGGTCLCISCSDHLSEELRTVRLFHCDFVVEDKLVVCMVSKKLTGFTTQWLDMWLYVESNTGERRVQLVGNRNILEVGESTASADGTDMRLLPLSNTSDEFRELQTYLVVNEPGFYVPTRNSFGWHVYYYQVPLGWARVTSINLRTSEAYGSILLGHVGLCARETKLSS